jgi:hypothetical protein
MRPVGIVISSRMTGKRTMHWMHPGMECREKQGYKDIRLKG